MSSGSRRATLEVNWCCGSICLQQEAFQPLIKPPPLPHHLTEGWRRSCVQLILHPSCYFLINYSNFFISVNFSIKFVFYKTALFSSLKSWPDVCLQALFPNSACCCCSCCCCCIFKNRSGVVFWLRATKLLLLCFFFHIKIFFDFFSLCTFCCVFLPSGLLLNLNISEAKSFCLCPAVNYHPVKKSCCYGRRDGVREWRTREEGRDERRDVEEAESDSRREGGWKTTKKNK